MRRSWRASLAAVTASALLAGCGAGSAPATTQASTTKTGSPPPSSPPASVTSAPPASVTSAPASPRPSGPPTSVPVAPGAGALPQTRAFPSADSAAFHHAMQDVWLAVTTGNARLALPAFFPLAAYQKLKAIYDPTSDWNDRLWYDFTLDVRAAHQAVAPDARLVRVLVAGYDAAWIYPGDCYNSIGYWHVSGARMVYQQDGQERSIGIASLISWRGVWYVVHFGAVLRSVVTGIVDQPETGPGIPGPAGGC
jgi:hypothetical protein